MCYLCISVFDHVSVVLDVQEISVSNVYMSSVMLREYRGNTEGKPREYRGKTEGILHYGMSPPIYKQASWPAWESYCLDMVE